MSVKVNQLNQGQDIQNDVPMDQRKQGGVSWRQLERHCYI